MNKLDIYCLTSKNYEFFKYLPKNIIPIVLGDNITPASNILSEKEGSNLIDYNKYFAELTGLYWVYKNKINDYDPDDWIGFCHYRRLWLNHNYSKNHSLNSTVFSKLLINKTKIFEGNDAIMLQPTNLKNEDLYHHFVNNHGSKLINEAFLILDKKISLEFQSYLKQNQFSIANMFITKKKKFIEYCEFIFPFLNSLLDYCFKNNLCIGKNIKLPAFLIERFTSFWFHRHARVGYLSYALLNNYFISNTNNKFFNTLNTPFCFRLYPTILDI
tara:strand:- start:244 stop:1059 length:816 start_codon:yes stop_codon:yes gene_type:complete